MEFTLPPVFRPKVVPAVVEQVELHIAPAAYQLFVPCLGPGSLEIAPHQREIDAQERSPTALVKSKSASSIAVLW